MPGDGEPFRPHRLVVGVGDEPAGAPGAGGVVPPGGGDGQVGDRAGEFRGEPEGLPRLRRGEQIPGQQVHRVAHPGGVELDPVEPVPAALPGVPLAGVAEVLADQGAEQPPTHGVGGPGQRRAVPVEQLRGVRGQPGRGTGGRVDDGVAGHPNTAIGLSR